ncbi:dihydroneopterin aldolase [Desulforamulus putei DSM 12395]|uniref:7,8-dihydroneopterin aldolase n=1 Tax=Desulforamulus putei DSM 12395 TaxID=1121429 RepID=A0A1M5C5G9_9FIRM|nr:dihydroneopterin aldolase [Desulforamulus putei]SHF49989.1 dihydroneopterin aldolase [Desulforamulus putei DSM 12395]
MRDKIILKGMRFYGYHGVLPEEQRLGQQFEVDLELLTDLKPAGESDDLVRSVSYADVFDTVEQVITGPPCRLLEAVAENISRRVLQQYPAVQEVKVAVKKPGAPIRGNFCYMAVEISRRRGSGA